MLPTEPLGVDLASLRPPVAPILEGRKRDASVLRDAHIVDEAMALSAHRMAGTSTTPWGLARPAV